MRFRKLRIVWSVGWGLAAVLLIVIWAHSGVHVGGVGWRSATHGVHVHSIMGYVIVVEAHEFKPQYAFPNWEWHVGSKPITDPVNVRRDIMNYHKALGFGWGESLGQRFLMAPHWFLVSVFATLAVLPWIRQLRWRFSYVGACQV